MSRTLRRWLKILVSGALFALLAVGGALASFLVLPFLALRRGDPAAAQARSARMISRFFRGFVLGLEGSGILRVEAEDLPGMEALGGSLVLADHPSYLDIVILIALLPGAICVVKEGVWRNPFFGPLVRSAGFIPNIDPERTLASGQAALAAGKTLIIFPDGTRTLPGQRRRFHRGSAHLALASGAPIFAFHITADPPLLAKGHRWYHIPAETVVFRIRSARALPRPEGLPAGDPLGRRSRRLTQALEGLFQQAPHDAPRHAP